MEFRDPDNAVYFFSGSWYRIASDRSAGVLDRLREDILYRELVNSGSLLGYERVGVVEARTVLDAAQSTLGSSRRLGDAVYRVESLTSHSYPWEWPDELLRRAGLLTLSIRSRLLEIGLDLKDASALNISFRGTTPVLLDIGSIESWRPHPSWNAARQFAEHFLNPLVVAAVTGLTAAEFWSITRRTGLSSQQARSLLPLRTRMRPRLTLLQQSTRSGGRRAPVEVALSAGTEAERGLAMQATVALTRRFKSEMERLRSQDARRTTWVDYGSRGHYTEASLQTKLDLATAFITREEGRSRLVLDVGGNDGLTASHLRSTAGANVIIIDRDAGALDQFLARESGSALSGSTATILPLAADLTNLTWGSGVLGESVQSFTSRMSPSAVICQAVLHHIVITQGLPLPTVAASLAAFGAPLQVEFATENDPKVELLISQIPGWSGVYSLAALLDALRVHFRDVAIVGTTTEHRSVVEAVNLR